MTPEPLKEPLTAEQLAKNIFYKPITLEGVEAAIQAHTEGLEAQVAALVDTLEKSLFPEYQQCDGFCCTGCWKDLARNAIKDTQTTAQAYEARLTERVRVDVINQCINAIDDGSCSIVQEAGILHAIELVETLLDKEKE